MTDTLTASPAWRPQTALIRGGTTRSEHDETSEALYMTSGYVYGSAEEAAGAFAETNPRYIYSRYGNPTVTMFEERLRQLEGAEACRATSSGMAAVYAALVSSLVNAPLPTDAVYFGEISLSGAIRPVAQTPARLKEALKLGFGRAILPESARGDGGGDSGLSLNSVGNLTTLVAEIAARGTPRGGRAVPRDDQGGSRGADAAEKNATPAPRNSAAITTSPTTCFIIIQIN